MMQKTLDQKLKKIVEDSSRRDFILADAKDPDMGFGISAPGPRYSSFGELIGVRSLPEFRQQIRQIVEQGLIDIMLMSPSTAEALALEEKLFDESSVTPAVRANDSTDIWCANIGDYKNQPSLPFRSSSILQLMTARQGKSRKSRRSRIDLGLYSVTFNNDSQLDRESLEHYKQFRHEAEELGFRHFWEVFAPNCLRDRPVRDVGRFVNDCIVRTLAGIPKAQRPLFLKMPYFGPVYMEELANYDPTLVIGVLGGSSGTTRDAFQLLWDAKRYGARAALFGRKINQAEDQLAMIECLRLLSDGEIEPMEAVRRYHSMLETMGIRPLRSLEEDMQLSVG